MNKPKISVIIPVYNVEKYLRECLDSVVNQTFKDIEIICIDDGSKDLSYSILEEYAQKDERFILIKQENSGAGAARNKGIEVARGEYLYFLDSDDFVDITLLEKAHTKIKENDCDVCIFKNYFYNDNTKEKYINKNWENRFYYLKNKKTFNRESFPKAFYLIFNIAAFTKLYRKNFIIKNSIRFQEIKTCNDVFFNFYTLSKADKITLLNEYLVTYRIAQTGSLSANRNKSIECIKSAFNILKEKLIQDNLFNLLEITYYKRYVWAVEYETSLLGTKKEKQEWIKELLKDVPKKYWTPKLKAYFEPKYLKRLKKIFSITYFERSKHIMIYFLGIKLNLRLK